MLNWIKLGVWIGCGTIFKGRELTCWDTFWDRKEKTIRRHGNRRIKQYQMFWRKELYLLKCEFKMEHHSKAQATLNHNCETENPICPGNTRYMDRSVIELRLKVISISQRNNRSERKCVWLIFTEALCDRVEQLKILMMEKLFEMQTEGPLVRLPFESSVRVRMWYFIRSKKSIIRNNWQKLFTKNHSRARNILTASASWFCPALLLWVKLECRRWTWDS